MRREGELEAGLDELAAQRPHGLERRLVARAHAGLDAADAVERDGPDAQAAQILALGELDRLGRPDAGRVAGVGAGDHAQRERAVAHGARERADLVERARERHGAVARDRAVGRLHADDAAQRGGLADRAAGVGAERERRHGRRPRQRPSRRWSRRARARDPTGCASGRRPSSRSTSPSRTRPCSSCRARPDPRPRSGAPRSPCTAAGSPRARASRPSSARRGCRAGPCRRSARRRCRVRPSLSRARARVSTRSWSTCRKTFRSSLSASVRAR